MPLSSELIEALTPRFPPPEQYEPQRDARPNDPELHRWQWSQLMVRGGFADQVVRAALEVEGAWYAGLGLVPWTGTESPPEVPENISDAVFEAGYVWGGLVLTSVPQRPYFLGDRLLWLEGPVFPIVVRHARYWPQALEVCDTRGILGTSTSWVRATTNHPHCPGLEGCSTAAHVLGSGGRNYDIMDGGSFVGSAAVEEFGPPCLDAAFLKQPWPRAMTPYVPQPPTAIAFGDAAAFDGAVTSSVTGYVTHISAHAKYSGSGVPMILCHDGLGAAGDSGALVEVNGAPTAMHLGKIELDGHAGFESRGVFLHQISHVMDLEFAR